MQKILSLEVIKINKVFGVLSLFIVGICILVECDCVPGAQFVFILPLIYFICIVTSKRNKFMQYGPGMFTFNIILFARYCIVPLSICINNSLNIYAHDYKYLSSAIFIMCLEIVSVFVMFRFLKLKNLPEKKIVYSNMKFHKFKNNFIYAIIIIMLMLGIIYTNKGVLGSFYILTSNSVQNNIINETPGMITMLWKAMLTFFMLYLIALIKNSHLKIEIKELLSVIIALIYLLLVYIGQASISRWFLLVSAISILFMLIELYPTKRKSILMIILIPIVVVLVTASITKNTGLSGNYTFGDIIKELLSPTNMDTYFAGPVSVNNAIGMKLNKDISIFNLPYDIFNNFPGIADSINKNMVSNHIYNYYIFNISTRNDQILPLVGQSFSLFTFIFTPLLSLIAARLVIYFDKKYYESIDLRGYCFAFSAVWLGIAQVLNMTITISWFYSVIIPLYLILWMYEKIMIKK